ncbi:MAG: hypothetical protein JWN68_2634, partial [Nocardioides sp.]|nr:hypothetical protein [Nocardioides sp.]
SIKSYIKSCYRKIEVDSRSKAVLWALTHGLSTVDDHAGTAHRVAESPPAT